MGSNDVLAVPVYMQQVIRVDVYRACLAKIIHLALLHSSFSMCLLSDALLECSH